MVLYNPKILFQFAPGISRIIRRYEKMLAYNVYEFVVLTGLFFFHS